MWTVKRNAARDVYFIANDTHRLVDNETYLTREDAQASQAGPVPRTSHGPRLPESVCTGSEEMFGGGEDDAELSI